jgi:methylglyoxal reductase
MQYIKLGKSDLHVSRIALGTWAIGGADWGPYDESMAVKAIETAIENGINIIDTAPAYGDGHAEELIGKIITNREDKVVIATKCGLDLKANFRPNLTPEFIEQDVTNSLKRLKRDCIDLYQCHWPDRNTPLVDTMEKMSALEKQGKIRYIGVSNYSDQEIREAMQYVPLLSLQPPYSLLDRRMEKEIQKTCLEYNIAIIPYGSLGAGMLTGKYKEWPKFKKSDARSFFYRFFEKRYWPKIRTLIDALEQIASEKRTRPGNVALAWLLAQEGVSSAIVGARSPAQVLENIKAAEVVLSEEEKRLLNSLSGAVY